MLSLALYALVSLLVAQVIIAIAGDKESAVFAIFWPLGLFCLPLLCVAYPVWFIWQACQTR